MKVFLDVKLAPSDSWYGTYRRLPGVWGEAVHGDNPGWTRPGPVETGGCSEVPRDLKPRSQR